MEEDIFKKLDELGLMSDKDKLLIFEVLKGIAEFLKCPKRKDERNILGTVMHLCDHISFALTDWLTSQQANRN